MIKVTFLKSEGELVGYEFGGHSDYAAQGEDIVCAAVSSAAYLAANTLCDSFGIEADVTVDDGYMKLVAVRSDTTARLLVGLYRHMLQLEEQYEKDIKVIISEV